MNEEALVNGHRMLPHYAEYWRQHPEIGLPVSDPRPDGAQLFERAVLQWEDGAVLASHYPEPLPEYGPPAA